MPPGGVLGARPRVESQRWGFLACLPPWISPFHPSLGPLADLLSAENKTIIKPSESTPATSELMKEMFEEAFDIEEVAVFTGGPEVGGAFSSLPFDHLLFTGATSVAKHVMRAASENLVPVTLELGGKSPVVIGKSADMEMTATNVMAGKTMNAGQNCPAPDHIFLPEERANDFFYAGKTSVKKKVSFKNLPAPQTGPEIGCRPLL